MSSLWTPGGERPVPRGDDQPVDDLPGHDHDLPGHDHEVSPEELQAMLQEIASTPAFAVVINHAVGMFELARIHLSVQPPQLSEAQLAIDAVAGVLDACQGRLGPDEGPLRDGLAQIRLAFVQIKASMGGAANGEAEPG